MADRPYTEETRDLAYHAAFDRGPCEHWLGSPDDGYATCIGCYVDAALDALVAAGRLIPPGSEVREEWSAVFGPDDALYCGSEMRARKRAGEDGGTVESRQVITTPWTAAAPAPMEDR